MSSKILKLAFIQDTLILISIIFRTFVMELANFLKLVFVKFIHFKQVPIDYVTIKFSSRQKLRLLVLQEIDVISLCCNYTYKTISCVSDINARF